VQRAVTWILRPRQKILPSKFGMGGTCWPKNTCKTTQVAFKNYTFVTIGGTTSWGWSFMESTQSEVWKPYGHLV